MSNSQLVLVTGATGQQGGAVARQLLARGHRVRAMTRRADSPAARDLADRGAEIVGGDFDDPASLIRAADGVDAVFAMSAFWERGVEAEVAQGTALVDAASAVGVGHFVFSSVSGADRGSGVPHFDSKFRVEQHLGGSGLAHTIIRPAFFMENAITYGAEALARGTLSLAMSPDRPLQQITVADIGRFAALVIEDRERFTGLAIDIAADELSGAEAAKVISAAAGITVEFEQLPLDAVRAASADLGAMYEFFERTGLSADIDALRCEYPDVGWQRFGEWAAGQNWTGVVGR